MLVIQILIKITHYQFKMLHAIYFTDSWDRGMGWTIRYSCVSERDRWTSRGMSHNPMGPWDGMDSRTHAPVEGQVDIPWKVPWDCGMGWTIPCNSMIPWDRGMGWTIYGICGQPTLGPAQQERDVNIN